jgi:hypothetical protein
MFYFHLKLCNYSAANKYTRFSKEKTSMILSERITYLLNLASSENKLLSLSLNLVGRLTFTVT